ncbi:MAG TPA: RNA 2',3'-cyclic phosphodiesterase [Pirellulales bacterium]|jgi:2'-5' RNA ligase
MQNSVRTFIAVEISSEVRSRAARLISQLEATGANVRWVKPEQMHLTLKFLGDVDMREIPEICAAVSQATADVPPFSLRMAGAGAFPNLSQPRTIWLGADDGVDEIQDLHQRLDQSLAKLGFRPEPRRFRPHLTIGRVRNADRGMAEMARLLEEHANFVAGVIDVDEVVTFSSELERAGPNHETLATAELGGS